MNKIKPLFGPMRLPFLLLPPMCVLLGVGVAVWEKGTINIYYGILAFIGAVASHISVNAFNEYFDFKSGLDAKTIKTPFSGGSGVLQAHPELARVALLTALIAWVITGLIGLYFIFVHGWGFLPIGLLGAVIIIVYTPWITHNPIMCLLVPGLGFGTLWVMGTYFALTGQYSWSAFIASFVPFFLVNDLLLLNQFPDVDADKSIGRLHFPILIGRKTSSYIYGVFLALAYASIALGVVLRYLPPLALLGLGTLFFAMPAFLGANRHADDIPSLIPALGQNVLINLFTPLLVAIGLLISRSLQ
jgi:1,4-dihydroxy-2-naphthoate octaprenyltransferase